MNISISDYIFLIVAVGLLVTMIFFYRRTKRAMKANIREILEEYKELRQIAGELRKDAVNTKKIKPEIPRDAVTSQKAVDDYKDYQLRDYIYEVRQKNKADLDRAIKKLKDEIKIDLEEKLNQVQPKAKDVKPEAKKKEKTERIRKVKEVKAGETQSELTDEHLNVLYNLAEETGETALGVLYDNYKKVFPQRDRKEFQVVVRELIENNMIRESYAAAGDFFFTVTNEGLGYIRKKM